MTLKVWIKHDDVVDTMIFSGDGRHTYIRLVGDVRRYAETKGWGRPTVIKVREAIDIKHELPVQKLDFIKHMMAQGM